MTKRIICVLLMISLLFALSSVAFAAISAPEGVKVYSDNKYETELSAGDEIKYGNVMIARVYTTIPNGDNYMFILAKYLGDELLETNQGTITFGADATASLDAEEGCTYKAFLWTKDMVPVKKNYK